MGTPGNQLYQLYIKNDPQVASFFQYPLNSNWINIAETVCKNYKNNEFLKILADQNKGIDNPKFLKLLSEKNTVALVTGQQLGLFVSPLYTIYKILTTILYADKFSTEIKNYNFIPVFWLEGEDHDFAEINHVHYFDKNGQLSEVIHTEDENEIGYSISKRSISEQITDIINTMQSNLLETEFSTRLFENLNNIWKPRRKWNHAFADQLHLIFRHTGLLIFNPSDERVKKLSKPFFQYLIENNNEIVSAFTEQSDLVKDAGFDNQVFVDPNKSYIFLSHEGGARAALQKEGSDRISIKDSGTTWNKEQLLNILDNNPEWFSSTVLTRPIWQSWMLPVVSYIAGPGEIAYWAQLKSGFDKFNVQMPHVMPRFSFTIMEPKIKRLMKKYEIHMSEINGDLNNFIKEQVKKTQNPELENEFHQIQNQLSASSQNIQSHIDTIDPTLKSIVQKTFENAEGTINKLQNRILRRIEEKEGLAVQHFNEIHQSIFPNGSPQERIISSIYFLNKYGPDWLNTIINNIEMDNFEPQIIAL